MIFGERVYNHFSGLLGGKNPPNFEAGGGFVSYQGIQVPHFWSAFQGKMIRSNLWNLSLPLSKVIGGFGKHWVFRPICPHQVEWKAPFDPEKNTRKTAT